MAGRLKGKVAVVTGAAPRGEGVGNGMATAILFARDGARVVLVNRSKERAEKLADRIGIIAHGRLIAEGDLAQLRRLSAQNSAGRSASLEDVFLDLTARGVAA